MGPRSEYRWDNWQVVSEILLQDLIYPPCLQDPGVASYRVLTWNRISSIHKTNRRVDHKDPGLTGVAVIWFAGHVALTWSSTEREGLSARGIRTIVCFRIQTRARFSVISQELWSWVSQALCFSFSPLRLSRRRSGGTTGRMQIAVAGWALLGLCLFSLGLLFVLTFSWSTLIIDKQFSARNVPPETLQTALKSRLTNN